MILNFKVWTGKQTLYRKIYARVVHADSQLVGLEFAEHDFVAEAIIHDLMLYQRRERRKQARHASSLWNPAGVPVTATVDPIV